MGEWFHAGIDEGARLKKGVLAVDIDGHGGWWWFGGGGFDGIVTSGMSLSSAPYGTEGKGWLQSVGLVVLFRFDAGDL